MSRQDLAFGLLVLFASTLAQAGEGTPACDLLDQSGIQGGLVVHVGCGEGRLTAALHAGENYLVHGLDADPANVEKARQYIRSLGLYGPVSVEQWSGGRLPYADNLVNLIVADDPGRVSAAEALRVLVPGGVAYVRRSGRWEKTVKPWPGEIDEWTHWLHDASNNAVAHDTCVGPPRRMQWVAEPLWARGHEVVSSVGALVTARGRIFYVLDEAQPGIYTLPSQWNLVARDAFNGLLLWKRPVPDWNPPVTLGGFNVGFRPRRLVTDGRRVYLPTGEEAVLTALDAATGKPWKTLDDARGTAEILSADGLLVVVVSPKIDAGAKRRGRAPSGGASLIAVRSDAFDVLWKAPAAGIVSGTAALAADRVFYLDGDQLVGLDARTGRQAWRSPLQPQAGKTPRRPPAGTLLVYNKTIYIQSGSRLMAFSAETGRPIWERKNAPGTRGELFAAGGLLWRTAGKGVVGHDPATGEIRQSIDASAVFTEGHHPRCYPAKATDRYVITNNRGAEFVSLTSDRHVENDWLRGNCGHGVMPANGLLYAPPNQCFCYPGVKLTGFNALAPAETVESPEPAAEEGSPLKRGPAYEAVQRQQGAETAGDTDWPTYRHDAARTGAAGCDVPPQISLRWTAALRGKPTPPVVAAGRVYVAAKDEHTLYALAAGDGRPLWHFTAGGRIDSPPTVFDGLLIFGAADGHVYCLRAADGQLAWRFRAAPKERRIIAFGQLESPWRVHGSVLITKGIAYCTAGRSSYLDGGIWVFGLDPRTGEVRHQARLDTWAPTREDAVGKPFIPGYHMEGAQSDILTSQGGSIYLGQVKFDLSLRQQDAPYLLPDPRHKTVAMDLAGQPFVVPDADPDQDYEAHQRDWLERTQKDLLARLRQSHGGFNVGVRRMGLRVFSTAGFLDDSWFNRTYWMYSTVWPGFYLAHRAAKTGQLLVVGPQKTYAVQAFPSRNLQSPLFTPGTTGYLLVADANDNEPVLDDRTVETTKGWGFTRAKPPAWFAWAPIRIRAMVLAGKTLFVAGPPDVVDPADPAAAFEGRRGALLRAVSSTDGKQLAEIQLDAEPVFDGLAAAAGRLYLATADGRLLCYQAGR